MLTWQSAKIPPDSREYLVFCALSGTVFGGYYDPATETFYACTVQTWVEKIPEESKGIRKGVRASYTKGAVRCWRFIDPPPSLEAMGRRG